MWVTIRAEGATQKYSVLNIIYVLVFVILVFMLYCQRKRFLWPYTRYFKNKIAERRKHLILFLSNLDTEKFKFIDGIPDGLHLTDDLYQDLETIKESKGSKNIWWSWEMPLRGIRHHLDIKDKGLEKELKTVTVICSEKSIMQFHWFLKICKTYKQLDGVKFYLMALFPKDEKPVLKEVNSKNDFTGFKGFDFEDFDELSRAIIKLFKIFRKKKYEEEDIMIDITGGQKPTSIIGASMSFNRSVAAQYVQTEKDKSATDLKVKGYDVYLYLDTGGFGP